MAAEVIIDTQSHRHAVGWYRLRRPEPIGTGTLAIGAVHALSNYSLDSVMDEIIANVPSGSDLIIVGHGRDIGLAARLLPGSSARFRSEVANALANDRPSQSSIGVLPAITAAQAASTADITEAEVVALRAKMTQVRAKNLGHVAFRACNMGAWPSTLDGYLRFFGCQAVSAPDLRDTYGEFRVPGPERNFEQWLRQHSTGNWHQYTYGVSPNRVAVATSGGDDDEHSYRIEVAAESQSGFTNWRSEQLTAGSFGSVVYHGVFRRVRLSGQRVTFVGDRDYASHIVTRRR